MEPNGEKRHGATGEIITRIIDELIIGGNVNAVSDRVFVIGLVLFHSWCKSAGGFARRINISHQAG